MAGRKQQLKVNNESTRREASRRRIDQEATIQSTVSEQIKIKPQENQKQLEEEKFADQINAIDAKKAKEDIFDITPHKNAKVEIVKFTDLEESQRDNGYTNILREALSSKILSKAVIKLSASLTNKKEIYLTEEDSWVNNLNNIVDEKVVADTSGAQSEVRQSLGINSNTEYYQGNAISIYNSQNIRESQSLDNLNDLDELAESLIQAEGNARDIEKPVEQTFEGNQFDISPLLLSSDEDNVNQDSALVQEKLPSIPNPPPEQPVQNLINPENVSQVEQPELSSAATKELSIELEDSNPAIPGEIQDGPDKFKDKEKNFNSYNQDSIVKKASYLDEIKEFKEDFKLKSGAPQGWLAPVIDDYLARNATAEQASASLLKIIKDEKVSKFGDLKASDNYLYTKTLNYLPSQLRLKIFAIYSALHSTSKAITAKLDIITDLLESKNNDSDEMSTNFNDQKIEEQTAKLLYEYKNRVDAIKNESTQKTEEPKHSGYREEYNKLLNALVPIAEKAKEAKAKATLDKIKEFKEDFKLKSGAPQGWLAPVIDDYLARNATVEQASTSLLKIIKDEKISKFGDLKVSDNYLFTKTSNYLPPQLRLKIFALFSAIQNEASASKAIKVKLDIITDFLESKNNDSDEMSTNFNDQKIGEQTAKLLYEHKNRVDAIKNESTQKTEESKHSRYREEYNKLLNALVPIAAKAEEAKAKAAVDGTASAKKIATLWEKDSANIYVDDPLSDLKFSPKALAPKAVDKADEILRSKDHIKSQSGHEATPVDLLGFTD